MLRILRENVEEVLDWKDPNEGYPVSRDDPSFCRRHGLGLFLNDPAQLRRRCPLPSRNLDEALVPDLEADPPRRNEERGGAVRDEGQGNFIVLEVPLRRLS